MDFEAGDSRRYNLLLDSATRAPKALASWYSNGGKVFVSDKLKSLLNAEDNFLSIYDFIKRINNYFGDFLYAASEKISSQESIRSEYCSVIKTNSKEEFLARLVFDKKKELYIFIIEKVQKQESNITNNVLNSVPFYVWERDLDLRLTYCNKKYSDALETSQENAIANDLNLISPRSNKNIANNLRSERQTVEKVVIKGSRRYLEVTERPFIGNYPALSFAIDVTEREELRKEYENYKKQIAETLGQISAPIAIFDEKTRLVFANPAIGRLFGLDINILNEKNFSEIISILSDKGIILSDKEDKEFKEKAAALFAEIIEPYCVTINMRNGKIVNATISPNCDGGLIFLFEDISDTISLKREVSSISAVQEETLDHLKEGLVIFGTDNRVKIINSAMLSICENENLKDHKEKHIKEFLEIISLAVKGSLESEFWIPKTISMAAQRIPFSDALSSNSKRVIEYSYFPLPEGLGLLRFCDTTDKANLEKALKEKTDMISQIDQIKTNLISNINLELRASLNAITSFANVLANEYFGELNDKQLEYCKTIGEAVDKITETIDAITKLTGMEAGQIELKYDEINLFNFINDLLVLFQKKAEAKNIVLQNAFKDKDFTVRFDEQSMRQAVFQIILRSLKQISEGGDIIVSVEIPENESDYLYIVISDTSAGIPKENLEIIRKTLSSGIDTSLINDPVEFGILFANSVLSLHNGSLLIDSERGKGVVVKCRLPI